MTKKPPLIGKRRGIIFIISAPSGAGKTTLITRLRSIYSELKLSVSCTTRARRNGEVNGRDYYFITPEEFAGMRARGEFAEWAQVHDFLYATPRKPLDQCISGGGDILLDIDVQGARKVKRAYPEAVSIFLLPPSFHELERRLASRGTEARETMRRRLSNARDEIPAILKYDYYVVNRDVREAIGVLESIVEAERARTSRVSGWRFDLLQEERRKRAHEQRN